MKLKVLIIEDEPDALDKLGSYVDSIPFYELVASCQGPTEALDYMSMHRVDVIYTDIDMPDINGIAFAESLTRRTMIVFTTAYREFAAEAFRVSAIDYLVKPFGMKEFQRSANKVLEVWQSRSNRRQSNTYGGDSDSLFIKVETRFERVSQSDIRYVKGYGEYLQIFVEGEPIPLLTLSSFAEIRKRLDSRFVQIHRSYIVNMDKVVQIEKSRVMMDEETEIPITAKYREELAKYLSRCSVGRTLKP